MSLPATEPGVPAPARTPKRGFFIALRWALASAACAGGAWAAALVACGWFFDISFFPGDFPNGAVQFALLHAAIGEGYGLLVGAVVGFLRGKGKRLLSALVLGFGCAFFGGFGGGLSVLAAAIADERVHPVISSSLAWAVVGFLMGLCGYRWSHSTAEHVEPSETDVRLLPMLLVSACSLVGATIFAPSGRSLALFAVGVLGLSVALVLHNQDTRLRALENHFRNRGES
jgi:hypothetical protein